MKGCVILIDLVNKQDFTFPNVGCGHVDACGCYLRSCQCNGSYCEPQPYSSKVTPLSDNAEI